MFSFLKNIGPTELIIITLILILLFGAKIITNLAKTSGETLREAKKLKREITDSVKDND